jgi:hypothetical protein
LINHSLSGLQAAILVTVLTKRVPGARGADVSQAELLVAIWGWKTEYKLRWTEDDVAGRHDKRPASLAAPSPIRSRRAAHARRRLAHGIATLVSVERRQVVQRCRNMRMFGTECAF